MAEVDAKKEARLRFARLQKKASQLGLNSNDILKLGIIQEHQKPINISRILYKTVFYLAIVLGLVVTLGFGGKLFVTKFCKISYLILIRHNLIIRFSYLLVCSTL